MPDEQAGAPSTPEERDAAQDAALESNDFARYVEVENARESNTAIPEAPPASTTEKNPASETGTAKEIQDRKKAPGAPERIKELLDQRIILENENLRLKAEIEKGKTPAAKAAEPPPAAAEPAKAAAAVPAKAEAPKKPSVNDFTTYGEYEAANDAYIADLVTFKAAALIAENDTKREQAAAQKLDVDRSNARIAAAKEEFADFAEVAFSPTTPITGVMHGFLKSSEQEMRVLYKLGENSGAEAKRIAALDPYAQVRSLIAIETALGDAPGKKAAAQVTTTPVKKHTAAPPPATSLGGNDRENADAGEAALASGSFAQYMAQANAAEKKAAGR